jgi:hypothetical protein
MSTLTQKVVRRFLAATLPPVTVFHGTDAGLLSQIRSKGLISPVGYDSPAWFMVAEDITSAAFHTVADDDRQPIVIEYKVPTEPKVREDGTKRIMWPGYPYLWKPEHKTWGGKSTNWYALRQPLPASFIKAIHRLSKEQWQKYRDESQEPKG